MSQQQHTQEPWRISRRGNEVVGSNGLGDTVAMMVDCDSDEQTHANARRIVACVNACAGIPTGMLERFKAIVGAMDEVSKIEKQRDDLQAELTAARNCLLREVMQRDTLLAALEELNSVSARGFLYDDPARVKARAAIASVKEQA